jgi:hypothetical protein
MASDNSGNQPTSMYNKAFANIHLGNNPCTSTSTAASLHPSLDLNLLILEGLVQGLQQQQGRQGQQQQSGMLHLSWAQALQQQATHERSL